MSWAVCSRSQVCLGLSVPVARCVLGCLSLYVGVSRFVCPRTQGYLGLSPPPPRYLGVSWSVCQRVQVYLGLSVNVSRCILVCLLMCPGVSWRCTGWSTTAPPTTVYLGLSVNVSRCILVCLSMCPGVSWSVCQCVQVSLGLSANVSRCILVCLSTCPGVYLGLSVNVSRCIFICLSTCPGVSWSVGQCVQVYLGLSVNVSRCILVCRSMCPGVSWSVGQCIQVYLGLSVNVSRCILALYGLVNNCSTNNEGSDVSTPSFHLVIAIADILNILNSCLNIVVYCLTGTRFRREVKQLLLCRSCLASYLLFCLPRELPPLLSASPAHTVPHFHFPWNVSCSLLSAVSHSVPLPARSLPLLCTLCSLLVRACVRACVRVCECVCDVFSFVHEFSLYTYGWHIITYCYSL